MTSVAMENAVTAPSTGPKFHWKTTASTMVRIFMEKSSGQVNQVTAQGVARCSTWDGMSDRVNAFIWIPLVWDDLGWESLPLRLLVGAVARSWTRCPASWAGERTGQSEQKRCWTRALELSSISSGGTPRLT